MCLRQPRHFLNCCKEKVTLTLFQTTSLKEFADNNFKFIENGRKLSKQVENTVGKDEQFLLFPQCFQKACFPRELKGVIVWVWVKSKPGCPYQTDPIMLRNFPTGISKSCLYQTGCQLVQTRTRTRQSMLLMAFPSECFWILRSICD